MAFERITELSGAFDKTHPDPSKNYGVGGMHIRHVLKGEKGAVQFVAYLGQFLPHVVDRMVLTGKPGQNYSLYGTGADIGYHSHVPQYEDQPVIQECCPYLDGKPCYYDGSGLAADEFFKEDYIHNGTKNVWDMLEKRYVELFGEDSK